MEYLPSYHIHRSKTSSLLPLREGSTGYRLDGKPSTPPRSRPYPSYHGNPHAISATCPLRRVISVLRALTRQPEPAQIIMFAFRDLCLPRAARGTVLLAYKDSAAAQSGKNMRPVSLFTSATSHLHHPFHDVCSLFVPQGAAQSRLPGYTGQCLLSFAMRLAVDR